ncbi:hypothetical protein O7630_16745 [Micromonospora sp. WMMD718]|uniref:hypothetical protein n=1 Tax=unclassified Micromonospora TaxID=2617518 RepID=UPI00064BE638|nr:MULTISPECIES: hypothetical protein [unclassified Micromonospora]MDG4752595.1 hypothetical protein [Micromonospora sp. WMMD718]
MSSDLGQTITCTFDNRLRGHLPVTGLKLTGVIAGTVATMLTGTALLLVGKRRRTHTVND